MFAGYWKNNDAFGDSDHFRFEYHRERNKRSGGKLRTQSAI